MTMASSPIGWNASQEPERERRLELHAVERDLQVGARQADPVDAAGHDGPFLAEGLADGLPVGLGEGKGGDGQGDEGRQICNAHDAFSRRPPFDPAPGVGRVMGMTVQ